MSKQQREFAINQAKNIIKAKNKLKMPTFNFKDIMNKCGIKNPIMTNTYEMRDVQEYMINNHPALLFLCH